MCSLRVNGALASPFSSHPLPSPLAQKTTNNPLQITALRTLILRFLDTHTLPAFHSTCREFAKTIAFGQAVLDIRQKAVDVNTLLYVHQRYHPQGLRVKLSAESDNEDLIRLSEHNVPILSLDISRCRHITPEGLITVSDKFSSLEELHVTNHYSQVFDFEILRTLCSAFPLKALHIKSNFNAPRGLVDTLLSLSYENHNRFCELPIKSIDLRTQGAVIVDSNTLLFGLSKLRALETLFLPKLYPDDNPCVPLTSLGIEALSKLPNLKHLSISHIQEEKAFASLGLLIHLESLHITNTRIHDHLMAFLKPLRLRKLHIERYRPLDLENSENTITEKGIEHIKDHPLVEFSVNDMPITCGILKALSEFAHLGILRCIDCHIVDEGLVYFKNHRHLKILDLSGSRIQGTGLRHLSHPLAKYLHRIEKTGASDLIPQLDNYLLGLSTRKSPFRKPLDQLVLNEVLTPTSFASLEGIQATVIDIKGFNYGDGDLGVLKRSTVKTLNISYRFLLKDTSLLSLSTLPFLRKASFGISSEASDHALHSLRNLKLKHLLVTCSKVNDRLLFYISQIKTLESLSFQDPTMEKITASGIRCLKNLKHLDCILDTSPRVNPLRDYIFKRIHQMKPLLREEWFFRLFKNTACLQIKYPRRVAIRGEGGYAADNTNNAMHWDTPYYPVKDDDRTWVFYVKNISKKLLFKCSFNERMEIGPNHEAEPGKIHIVTPHFPPTILKTLYTVPRGHTLYARGKGPFLTWGKENPIPLSQVDDNTWQVAFRTPVHSYQIRLNDKEADASSERVISALGFGCTHPVIPHFSYTNSAAPFTVIQVRYAIPSGHTLFLHVEEEKNNSAIPMVQIGPDLWEARTKNPLSYKVFIDNIHEELGPAHPVESETHVCIPQFKDNLELSTQPSLTTIQVKYNAPAGHTFYLRTEHGSQPMVPVDDETWEASYAFAPSEIAVSLDDIVFAQGGAHKPIPGRINVIEPTFAFEQVLDRSIDIDNP